MSIGMTTACIALLFLVVVMISFGDNNSTVQSVFWAFTSTEVESSGSTLFTYYWFVGLKRYVVKIDSEVSYIDDSTTGTSYSDCKDSSDFCDDCNDASKVISAAVSIAFAAAVFSPFLSFQRLYLTTDLHFAKVAGIILNATTIIGSIVALGEFVEKCYDNLPDKISGYSVDWNLGVAYGLLIAVVLMKIVDVGLHLFTPVLSAEEDAQSIANNAENNNSTITPTVVIATPAQETQNNSLPNKV